MNKDVLWGHAFGNWHDITTVMKRVKKWNKMGFYLEVDQLDEYDRRQLENALQNRTAVDSIEKPWKHLIRDEFDISKELEVFHAKLYSPHLRIHYLPVKQQEPLDHYIIQQSAPDAYPSISIAMSKTDALRCIDNPAIGVISTVLKVVAQVDRCIDPKVMFTQAVIKASQAVIENPSAENRQKLKTLLSELEKYAD